LKYSDLVEEFDFFLSINSLLDRVEWGIVEREFSVPLCFPQPASKSQQETIKQ
jgi:hypothetical protein